MKLSEVLAKLLTTDVSTGSEIDPVNRPVYAEESAASFASPDHTVLFSGPPLLELAIQSSWPLVPIGLLTGVAENSQRPNMSFAEFGSNYRQSLPGVPQHNVTLQRIVGSSGNLIAALYGWLNASGAGQQAVNFPATDPSSPKHVVSFSSDLTLLPFGLYLCQMTAALDFVSAVYWENCILTGRGRTTSAGEAIVQENVQIVYERDRPARQLVKLATPSSSYTFPHTDASAAAAGTG